MWVLCRRQTSVLACWCLKRPDVVVFFFTVSEALICVWGHCWGMMSSEVKRLRWYITCSCSIKHEEYPLSTITHWHLQRKQDRGRGDVYLPFHEVIAYTQPHCSPLCARWIYVGILAVFCHLSEIGGINKVTGHRCLDWSDDVVCVCISCSDTITGGRNSESITFQCLSNLSEGRTPYQKCGCICCLHILLCRQGQINLKEFRIIFMYFHYMHAIMCWFYILWCLVGTTWKNLEAADGGWYS